jgi:hypothetical protein
MKKWEYELAVNCETEELNEYGLEGWELVAVAVEFVEAKDNFPKPVFYFKREIKQ